MCTEAAVRPVDRDPPGPSVRGSGTTRRLRPIADPLSGSLSETTTPGWPGGVVGRAVYSVEQCGITHFTGVPDGGFPEFWPRCSPGPDIDRLVLIDLETGQVYERRRDVIVVKLQPPVVTNPEQLDERDGIVIDSDHHVVQPGAAWNRYSRAHGYLPAIPQRGS